MDVINVLKANTGQSGRSAVISFGIAVLLVVGLVFLSGKLIIAYQDAQEIKQKIHSMETSLKEWNDKAETVSRAPLRPVDASQVDKIQSEIILSVQGHQLNLNGVKTVSVEKKNSNHMKSFEMITRGPYEKTVQFLQDFGSRNVLITMDSLDIKPDKGEIECTVKYTIYTK